MSEPTTVPNAEDEIEARVRADIRKLIPRYIPSGPTQNFFALGTFGGGLQTVVGGHRFVRDQRLHREPLSLDDIRKAAIGMLVYCEAHDDAP